MLEDCRKKAREAVSTQVGHNIQIEMVRARLRAKWDAFITVAVRGFVLKLSGAPRPDLGPST